MIGEADVTARRLDISGCENGLDVNQNITVEDSYIHDLYNGARGAHRRDPVRHRALRQRSARVRRGQHHDPAQHDLRDGRRRIVRDVCDHRPQLRRQITNVLIDSNLLAGGAYTLYCSIGFTGMNYRVVNNHFSTKFKSSVGYYGRSSDCGDETPVGQRHPGDRAGRELGLRARRPGRR